MSANIVSLIASAFAGALIGAAAFKLVTVGRLRLALLAVMVVWLICDAMYATRLRWPQVAEDAFWIALILAWPQVRRTLARVGRALAKEHQP